MLYSVDLLMYTPRNSSIITKAVSVAVCYFYEHESQTQILHLTFEVKNRKRSIECLQCRFCFKILYCYGRGTV